MIKKRRGGLFFPSYKVKPKEEVFASEAPLCLYELFFLQQCLWVREAIVYRQEVTDILNAVVQQRESVLFKQVFPAPEAADILISDE